MVVVVVSLGYFFFFCPFWLPCILVQLAHEIAYYLASMIVSTDAVTWVHILNAPRGSELRLALIFTRLKHLWNARCL